MAPCPDKHSGMMAVEERNRISYELVPIILGAPRSSLATFQQLFGNLGEVPQKFLPECVARVPVSLWGSGG